MNLPEGARGQFVAVALLLIVAIVAMKLIALPLWDLYHETGDDIFDMRQDISRYYVLAELPALEQLAERLRRDDPLAPVSFSGDNAALAAAELQQRLQDAAKKNGVKVISLRTLPPESDGPLERIAVEARMQAEIVGLRNMLFELETGVPYMFLDQLNIRARSVRRRQTTIETLEVRLQLSGMRGGGVRPARTGAQR